MSAPRETPRVASRTRLPVTAGLVLVTVLLTIAASGFPVVLRYISPIASDPAQSFTSADVASGVGPLGAGPSAPTQLLPHVADTLVLSNNTLEAGNFLAVNDWAPYSLAFDNSTGMIFAGDSDSGPISVISATTNLVVAQIGGGTHNGLAYDSAKKEIFASDTWAGNVTVYSATNYSVLATVSVGPDPWGVVYDSGKGEVFVANSGNNSLSVINDTNNSVVATIPHIQVDPNGLAYDSGKNEIFASDATGSNISVISDATNSVVHSISVGNESQVLVYDSAKGEIFVGDTYSGLYDYGVSNVSVVSDSSNSLVTKIQVGSLPDGLGYDSAKGEIFVANSNSADVSVISDSSNSVITNVSLRAYGAQPAGLAYDP